MSGAPPFWRASFIVPERAIDALLEVLEPLATSVAIVEDAADEHAQTIRWRAELLLAEAPDLVHLRAELARCCKPLGFTPKAIEVAPLPPQDWLAATSRDVPPVRVGRFYLHGSAHRHSRPLGTLAIEIEAGLAFGSGEHETTQCCLLALDGLASHRPRAVLDLGCGSGVLALAAARRWSVPVLAVDNDPVAVRVAAANAALNGVAGRVRTALSDGWRSPAVRRRRPYDLVLANILADPLIAMAGDLARSLAPGGHAILSGFVARDAERVLTAHRARGLRAAGRIDRPPWTALILRAPGRRRR